MDPLPLPPPAAQPDDPLSNRITSLTTNLLEKQTNITSLNKNIQNSQSIIRNNIHELRTILQNGKTPLQNVFDVVNLFVKREKERKNAKNTQKSSGSAYHTEKDAASKSESEPSETESDDSNGAIDAAEVQIQQLPTFINKQLQELQDAKHEIRLLKKDLKKQRLKHTKSLKALTADDPKTFNAQTQLISAKKRIQQVEDINSKIVKEVTRHQEILEKSKTLQLLLLDLGASTDQLDIHSRRSSVPPSPLTDGVNSSSERERDAIRRLQMERKQLEDHLRELNSELLASQAKQQQMEQELRRRTESEQIPLDRYTDLADSALSSLYETLIEHIPNYNLSSAASKLRRVKEETKSAFLNSYSQDKAARVQRSDNKYLVASNTATIANIELDSVKEQLADTVQQLESTSQSLESERTQWVATRQKLEERKAKAEFKLMAEQAKLQSIQQNLQKEVSANVSRMLALQQICDTEKTSSSTKEASLLAIKRRLTAEADNVAKNLQASIALARPASPVRGILT